MKNASKLIAAAITIVLLTGCNSNGGKTTDPSNLLLATETTAATETAKATTPKPTTKPTTKPSTSKPTTGKTDSAKATEATKPAEDQKPAASEPAATQKPAESQKPAETPKATEAPKPTDPPATEAPKPTNPPETEPPETEPPVVSLSCDDAIAYGRQYISSLGAILTPGLGNEYCGYYPAGVYYYPESQDELNYQVTLKIDADLSMLESRMERSGYDFNIADVRLDVSVDYEGDGTYVLTVYYG